MSDAPQRPIRILAVDGGGIRGVVPAVLLCALQKRLERPIGDYFDVIAGTSTGGLIAAGLCVPDDRGGQRYDVQQILRFYTEDCRQIFHRSLFHEIISLDGLLLPKYPATGMEAFLRGRFGDAQLAQARRLLLLVSYDIQKRQPFVFCSARAAKRADKNFLLRDACLATTAAPTFFPAAMIHDLAGEERYFIDGGVCSNDPMLPAFAEADEEFPGHPVLLVSLGTGNLTESLAIPHARRWGAISWATKILEVLMDGQSEMSEQCIKRLAKSRERPGSCYFRLQPDVPAGLGRLDDTSDESLAGLQQLAHAYCSEQAGLLARIVQALQTASASASNPSSD